jgi:hypothetical protein
LKPDGAFCSVAWPCRAFHAAFCSVVVRLSVSLAGRDTVEFDCDIPAADAAETPAISNPAASATDICLLMTISW